MSKNYHDTTAMRTIIALRKITSNLPAFCKDYFRSLETTTTPKTRLSYGYDLKLFFYFLKQNNPIFRDLPIQKISLSHLEKIQAVDIEEFIEFLRLYKDENGTVHTNKEAGISRKLSAVRGLYSYFMKHQRISNNPTLIIDNPKKRSHNIIRLDPDEVARLLDFVEQGTDTMSDQKLRYFNKNKVRNLAIFTLLLGTGIRVSECVGLDISDIDFRNNRIHIIRKGQKEDFVYFGDEVAETLHNYLKERHSIKALSGHEDALFLSTRRRRLCTRSIEHLVTDYASYLSTSKHITPHKLRSTYGTSLYRETGDIYLVAEVLGHNDVNTTKKHYAALDEDRKRRASNAVKLRK